MAKFWTFGVRIPALLLVALSIAIGAAAVADWSVALAAAALFGFIAEAAGHVAGRRRKKLKQHEATPIRSDKADAEAELLMKHIAILGDSRYDEDEAA